ncbi:unnamed protein product [Ilex paraguariensis]|uniref:AB hydrolase-1 domain-containing protein n=1 Tax=Ilex paraguariensis TaxID=185542 RepID=A0ABC8TE75_9AQUA
MEKSGGRHFVLVHGACHGAWCWFEVATLLRAAGHRVTAQDMAASGINPKQLYEIQTISDYLDPLLSFMASLPPDERVVLVGHSAGGAATSVVMERFPQKVAVAVFISALMPGPDFTLQAIGDKIIQGLDYFMDSKLTFDQGNRITSVLFGPMFLSTKLYQLSPPQVLTLAMLLGRPKRVFNDAQSLKDTTFTKENYGSVERVFIMCSEDKSITKENQMWMIENNPPNEVKMIHTDHMVMFSKPQELASNLQEIADKYY